MPHDYDEVASGDKRGVVVDLPAAAAYAPVSAVVTRGNFDACVATIGRHFLDILTDLNRYADVAEITIGKTYIKRRRTSRAPVERDNARHWGWEGPSSRWSNKYKKLNYNGLIVGYCFVRSDVPAGLDANGMDQEQLTLTYERAVTTWLRAQPVAGPLLRDGDDGGGGRRGKKTYAGYVLYMAFRFAD